VLDNPSFLLKETLEDFKLHPLRAAELVARIGDVPPDTDAIIKHHHERPDGSGFPQGITAQYFAPLTALFIMAHDYVDAALNSPGIVPIDEFFKKNKFRYNTGSFRKIYKSLEDKLATL